MKILIRTMRDKWGSRQHILFSDSDGIGKPLAVISDYEWDALVKMYDDEQQALDDLLMEQS